MCKAHHRFEIFFTSPLLRAGYPPAAPLSVCSSTVTCRSTGLKTQLAGAALADEPGPAQYNRAGNAVVSHAFAAFTTVRPRQLGFWLPTECYFTDRKVRKKITTCALIKHCVNAHEGLARWTKRRVADVGTFMNNHLYGIPSAVAVSRHLVIGYILAR